MLQRKIPQRIAQLTVVVRRFRIAPQRLRSVRMVDRRGHAHVVRTASLAEHGKPNGRHQTRLVLAQAVPDLWRFDPLVPRRPHLDLPGFAPIEAIGHDTVLARQPTGEHIGLHRPGDTGKTRREWHVVRKGLRQAGHGRQVLTTQTRYREHDHTSVHDIPPCSKRLPSWDVSAQVTSIRSTAPAQSSARDKRE